ncbi:MAG: cation-translocating P-type ATPase [Chloroflexi bacterium]|nr:cation-translocating P-type ATPase [Chloroflexota bacterium]
MKNTAWHSLSAEESIGKLKSSRTKGLNIEEVEKRRNSYGSNKLDEAPPPNIWVMLWAQFNDFVIWLLIGASIISAFLNEWVEASAIMAIVILNAIMGIIQERRAEEAMAALRQLAAPEAQVVRDGHHLVVPSHELVPGDIVIIEAGNYIPADVRLIESINLKIEEAALTGESVPVQKNDEQILAADASLGDRKNSGFMGTLANYGRAVAIVTNTGMSTQIGRIAEMLQAVEQEETPLQKRLDQLGKTLGFAALIISAIVFLVGWARGNAPLDMFLIAVSLAIAAVPEGLPAVVTISLALGMREMISKNALIRRLSSVETLGSATVIGSDKTGTLTQNEMTVTQISIENHDIQVTGTGYQPDGEFQIDGSDIELKNYPAALSALWVGALNNNALIELDEDGNYKMIGDPTEGSIIVAAAKADKNYQELGITYPRMQEIPFDSTRKRMATIHQVLNPHTDDPSPFKSGDSNVNKYVVAVKGAPDVILDLCSKYMKHNDVETNIDEAMRQRILKANDAMASKALRVIAVAYRVIDEIPEILVPEEIEEGLIFVGLIGMIDPPRPEVVDALAVAKNAGIRTVMITGDYAQTAQAIAKSIHLIDDKDDKVITGAVLAQMSEVELQEEIKRGSVFARVSPEHKVRIVQALRSNNEVVAMTGDGVNDAPALKQSDIGVAMGITGTDVAKETADMVLTDDNYSSIVSAIEQGRIIYSNIRKFVFYLLSCNMAEIAVIFIAILADLPSPLNPIQLLWLNLVTDGAPALALGMEKGDPDIMDQQPRPTDEPIINRLMRIGIVVQTIAITTVTLGAYLIGLKFYPVAPHEFNAMAATMAFITLSFSELIRAFTARSERYPILKIGFFKNKSMNWAVVISGLLLIAVIYVPFLQPVFETEPMTWAQWQYVLPLLFVPGIAAEITKWVIAKFKI